MIYKMTFERFNSFTDPMLDQKTDVVFRSSLEVPDGKDYRGILTIKEADEFSDTAWKEMWEQNPSWLLSHGPSTLNFAGWSSVLVDFESLVKVTVRERDIPEDLTGEGNMMVALTYHPMLPSDMRGVLKKAYERGVRDTENKKAERIGI